MQTYKVESESEVFFENDCFCPVCQIPSKMYRINENEYVASKIEFDTYASEYKWFNPIYSHINPLYHYLHSCSSCGYTDLPQNFKHGNKLNDMEERLQHFYLEMIQKNEEVITRLTEFVLGKDFSFERALAQHLLYIYVLEQLPEEKNIEYHLARVYLRLSWIYRENENELSNVQTSDSEYDANPLVAKFLDEYDTYLGSFISFRTAYQRFCASIDFEMKTLLDNSDINLHLFYNSFELFKESLKISCDKVDEQNAAFLEAEKEYKLSIVSSDAALSENYENVEKFLKILKEFWPKLPLGERKARMIAVGHYKRSLSLGYFQNHWGHFFKVSEIISKSYVILEEYKSALLFIDGLLKKIDSTYRRNIVIMEELRKKRSSFSESVKHIQNTLHKSAEGASLKEVLKSIDVDIEKALSDNRTIKSNYGKFMQLKKTAYQRFRDIEFNRAIKLIKENHVSSEKDILKLLKEYDVYHEVQKELIDRTKSKSTPNQSGKDGFIHRLFG